MNEPDLCWLAGFIEGEGCFTVSRPGKYVQVKIIVASCDKDVLMRCKRITGIGKIYGPFKKVSEQHANQYAWHVFRVSETRELLNLLHPLMGKRRKKRIKEVLALLKN